MRRMASACMQNGRRELVTLSNRRFVRVFLFLVAFAGTGQLMAWISTSGDPNLMKYSLVKETSTPGSLAYPLTSPSLPLRTSQYHQNEIRLDQSEHGPTVKAGTNISNSINEEETKIVSMATEKVVVRQASTIGITRRGVADILQVMGIGSATLINEPDRCNVVGGSFVIVVHSAPSHFEQRSVIRRTWGDGSRPHFVLGSTANLTLQARINDEAVKYKDLLQASFVDAYKNMTYKHAMVLAWSYEMCPCKYILKMDDDVFLNVPQVVEYISKLENGTLEEEDESHEKKDQEGIKGIFCDVVEDARVKRTFRSKWRLSFSEYPLSKFPNYCSGWIVVYKKNVIPLLLAQVKNVPFLWVDDVYVTGLLAETANVEPQQIEDDYLWRSYTDSKKMNKIRRVAFGPPDIDTNHVQFLWKLLASPVISK